MKKTYVLILALFFTLVANAQMVLEYEIPEAGKSIALPLSGDVDVTVDWGDGSQESFTEAGNKEHVYDTIGTKTVIIRGFLTHYGSSTNRGNSYLTAVKSWDGLGLTSLEYAFYKAAKLKEVPTSLPINVTNLRAMFSRAFEFNYPIGNWNTENVTDMAYMFNDADNFNQEIGDWNTSNVTTMKYMFHSVSDFNQPIGNWNTSSVTDMQYMFQGTWNFNQPIGDWNTGNVTNMQHMFDLARNFNQPIGNWDTRSLTDIKSMFREAYLFNQSIGNWNTENITNMYDVFHGAYAFNQPLENWNTAKVTIMANMFSHDSSFNQSIGNWNTSSVEDMSYMFSGASNFNAPLENWDTKNVTKMNAMFASASSFNQPIDHLNTDSVTDMRFMFTKASSFNQPLENWNTSSVTDMWEMFQDAVAFNNPLGNWDISAVKNMKDMFNRAALCTDNYDATLNGWASQTVQTGLEFDGGNSKYSAAGEAARATLAEKWTITDGGLGTTEHDKCAPLVGTEAYLASEPLEIYPNPVSDKLYINTTSLSSYAVYSLTGNLLEEAVGSEAEIDLSDLPSGIYILQTTSELGIRNQRFSKE